MMLRLLIHFFSALVLAAVLPLSPALADDPAFYCDGGEITINVNFPDDDFETAVIDFDGMDPITMDAVRAGSGMRFVGGNHELHLKGEEGTLVLPDGQKTECVSAKTVDGGANTTPGGNAAMAASMLPAKGLSYGGKVRAGPGTGHEQVGSLDLSQPVTLLEKTNVELNGYVWFKIEYGDGLTGYQWGGILCSPENVPGIFNPCRM